MFHKVLYRNFSGEVKITDIFMWQIWSGLYAANFIGIMQVLWKIWQKHFGTLFIVIFYFYWYVRWYIIGILTMFTTFKFYKVV